MKPFKNYLIYSILYDLYKGVYSFYSVHGMSKNLKINKRLTRVRYDWAKLICDKIKLES